MEGDILGIDLLDIVLHLLNFSILALGIYILIYKPVNDFMEKRSQHFIEMEESTKSALEEAEEKLEENNRRLASVQDEISTLKKQVIKDAEIEAAKRIEGAKKEEALILERAKQAAVFEREKILKDSRSELKQLIINAVDKTSDSEIDIFDSFIEASSQEANYEQN